jgi:hypothetical protein
MHFIAAQFAVEKFVARSESANAFMRGIVGQPLRLPNQNWRVVRLPCNFILARPPQNRAPVFALRLRMRCRPRVRIQNALRGTAVEIHCATDFESATMGAVARMFANSASETSEQKPRNARSFVANPQKFAAPAVNRLNRECAVSFDEKWSGLNCGDDFFRARKFTDTHDVNASVRLQQDSVMRRARRNSRESVSTTTRKPIGLNSVSK